jgi:hypothetical protein
MAVTAGVDGATAQEGVRSLRAHGDEAKSLSHFVSSHIVGPRTVTPQEAFQRTSPTA